MAQPLWRTVWCFLRELNRALSFVSAIPLLGIYSPHADIWGQSDPNRGVSRYKRPKAETARRSEPWP